MKRIYTPLKLPALFATIFISTMALAAEPDTARTYTPGSLRHRIWNIDNPMYAANLQTAIVDNFKPIDGKNNFSEYTLAQAQYRALLIIARKFPKEFFKELRENEPVFYLPGDSKEKPTYLLSRYHDVFESFGTPDTPPANLGVIYGTSMETTVHGPYMLSGEGQPANAEKPAMHAIVNQVPNEHGVLDSGLAMQRVRSIAKRLTIEAIQKSATADSLDVAAFVTRQVALGVVSEYFGFYPPDFYTQVQWSRNTQNSFFHNPLGFPPLNQLAKLSGGEMDDYVRNILLPDLQLQLHNGRAPYNTLAQMVVGHAGLAGTDRVVANTMGLLIGAGETSTLAVARALKSLMSRPEELRAAIAVAKRANVGDADAATLFDHYVWEALRFAPINPWVERRALNDYSIDAIKEHESTVDRAVTVSKDARVLVGMESGMMDSEKYSKPEEFILTRPLGDYMHVSINYHRCLGDDVALTMIPEILKQLLINLEDIRPVMVTVSPGVEQPAEIDSKKGPFPESWSVRFSKKSYLVGKPDSKMKAAKEFLFSKELAAAAGAASEVAKIKTYLEYSENPERVTNSGLRWISADLTERDQMIRSLESAMIAKKAAIDKPERCVQQMTVDALGIAAQRAFCTMPYPFRVCYFLQRTAGQKSTQHAFNQCVYGRETPLITSEQLKTATKGLKSARFYSFLTNL